MAYICADCRLYFSRPSTNCPRCGRRPVNDGHSEAELEALGYRLLALPDLSNRSARRSVIHDDDILAGLRRDYERQQASSRRPAEAEPSPPPPEEDFFAGLRRESTGTGPTPRIDLDPPERPAVRTPDLWEAPSPVWRESPRPRRREGLFSRLNRAAAIPWPLLLRIGFVVLVIAPAGNPMGHALGPGAGGAVPLHRPAPRPCDSLAALVHHPGQ